MNREEFGSWGIELSDLEFSQAIFVAGLIDYYHVTPFMIDEEETFNNIIRLLEDNNFFLKWSLISSSFETGWWASKKIFASTLVKLGSRLISNYGNLIRIGIIPSYYSFSDKNWILGQLSKSVLLLSSVYFLYEKEFKSDWDYPLRVGFLNDKLSYEFRSDIEDLKFFDKSLKGIHIKIINVNEEMTPCDILLLPHTLREALAALLKSPNALRANLVIVTGDFDETAGRAEPLLEAIRTQARAAGICLTPVKSEEVENYHLDTRQIWFKELIKEISHNNPIDVALFRASRQTELNALPPFIIATEELIENSQISKRIQKFGKQIANVKNKKIEVKLPNQNLEDLIRKTESTSASDFRTLNEISEGLEKSAEDFIWFREADMATSFSELKEATEKVLEKAPLPPETRWIQAEIRELEDAETSGIIKKTVKDSPELIAQKDYQIDVFVGNKSINSIEANLPFNETDLPPKQNSHQLTVFFTEPNVSPDPKVTKITLPRTGDSTKATFFIHIPKNIGTISGRIIVAYKNRILQSALLQAAVFENENMMFDSPENRKIELLVECVIRPGLQDLTERTWFDAAFLINHNQNNISQITKLISEDAELISLSGVEDKIKWFDEKISEVAKNWAKFETLEAKRSQDLLRDCARNGVSLYKALMAGRNEGLLAAAERIQIVSAHYGSRLPLEFVYGKRAPDLVAPLCNNAQQSLKDGHCGENCPKGRDEKQVICPLGFWGLSKVIERHAYDANVLKETKADFALQSEPIGIRKRLDVLKNALLACSDNVDAVDSGTSQKVVDALEKVTQNQSIRVNSWRDWEKDIDQRSPSLLVLLPHTSKNAATGSNYLEISGSERLEFPDIEREFILGPDGDPRPVVILMGCKTGSPDISYENIIHDFRSLGAALVVGTGSTILGRHAAPVTNALLESLTQTNATKVPFGDLMLSVRRQMVSNGLLMALCLTSYGDTDWLV